MHIYRSQRINLKSCSKSKFPRVSNKIIDKLWLDSNGRSGQEILEIALNLIGEYTFDKKYLREIDEWTFELKTTAGKLIRVQVECGDVEDCPQIIVTEDNNRVAYNYVPISGNSNLLYFDTEKQEDLEKGFTQYYNGDYDKILMKKDGLALIIYFYNPSDSLSYDEKCSTTFLVSDRLKESIKQAKSLNALEMYNIIANELDADINSFEIHEYDEKTRDTLNRIIIYNRKLAYIFLSKKYSNGSVSLEEDHRNEERFSVKIDNVRIDYDATLSEFDLLKRKMVRKINKKEE